MKKILLLQSSTLCLFLLMSSLAFSQIGSIKGRVITQDNKPADYLRVIIKETLQQTTTDENGEYEIKRVKTGTYNVSVSSIGLETRESSVTVVAQRTSVLNFTLAITNQSLQEVQIKATKNRYKVTNPSTSLRLDEPLLEAPQNIQIVGSQLMADRQVINMADGMIKNVSGLTRLDHWADLYTRVNARGSRMASFRNGVNVTSSWGPLSEDMSFVDHIEFVKGPAGFLMSNGEPSGIYNVVTKKPSGRGFNGEASFMLGSYDLYRTTVDVDGQADTSGKLLYRINLMGQNKKSFRNHEYNDRYAIAPVITYKIDDQTTLTAEYTYQYARMSDVGSAYSFAPAAYASLARNFTTADPGIEPTTINDNSAFVNLQHTINSNWKVTAQASYFNYKQEGTNLWPSVVNADGTIIRGAGIWDASSEYKFGQVFMNGNVTTGPVHHRILTGLDMGTKDYLADWNQTHNIDLPASPFDPLSTGYTVPANGYPVWNRTVPLAQRAGTGGTITQTYSGLYLQDELGFLDNKLRLTLAGRYTNVKQSSYGGAGQKADRITPRIGLSVSLNQVSSVYALYDQSFVPQAGFLRSGGNIKPITGNNLEFGIKRDWFDQKWNTTLTVYRILKNNELTSDPANAGTENFSVILGRSKAQGIEFDLKGTILPGLNVVANYAYTDSKVQEVTAGVNNISVGDRIPGYARHNINTWLNQKFLSGFLKGTGLSAGFSYQADRDTWTWGGRNGVATLPDYFRLDGGAFWEKGKVRLTANIFNILDKYLYTGGYEDWATPSYYSWQVEAPRNYRLSLAYKF